MSGMPKTADWIDRPGPAVPGPYPVSLAAIGYLAEALEDDELAAAVARGGTMTAPPAFVTIASRVPNWRPTGATGPDHFLRGMLVPLSADAAVNTALEQFYLLPLRVGDRLTTCSTIRSITPKTTRLGSGFFIVEEIEHRNQDGLLVARTLNTMFRYRATSTASSRESAPPAPSTATEPSRAASTAPPGAASWPLAISMTRLVVAAGAVRDFSPIHHDVAIAQARGHRTAFASFSFLAAYALRALGASAGPVRRIALSFKGPAYLGTTLRFSLTPDPAAGLAAARTATVRFSLGTEDGACADGTADVEPREQ